MFLSSGIDNVLDCPPPVRDSEMGAVMRRRHAFGMHPFRMLRAAASLLKPLSSGIIMVCLNPAGLIRNKGNEASVNDPSGALWRAQTTVLSRSGDREGAGAQWASGGSGGHI